VGEGTTPAGGGELLIERLLRVIDEGRRTATYKLALLAALIDAVAMSPGQLTIRTRLVAERVLALYFPQSRTYVAGDGVAHDLRQISMKSSPVLREVARLRAAASAARCRTLDEARTRVAIYGEVLDEVESTFVRYPIPLLQVVGTTVVPFLYEVDWSEGTSIRRLRADGRDELRLLPGVADQLVVLGPLLRPLIELHWSRDVARWSGIALEDSALHAHLFGIDRTAFPPPLVAGLVELQGGRCFYCDNPVAGRGHVDHFLAWSRWPNNAIENLVLADRCNLAKSDHLVTIDHLDHWLDHIDTNHTALADVATQARWSSDVNRSTALVRSTYAHISAGTPLWRHGADFDLALGPINR
jgi:hypothetical protein